MPQLYSKLMDTRKVEPLREINKSMDYRIIGREKAVNEGQEGTAETEYFVTTYQSTSGKEIEKEDTAEFGLYEEEMERIYAQYLSS